jgi:nicotinate-nucleotide pyrophosphorylase
MMFDFPDQEWIDTLIRQSLDEDIGSGDVTTAVSIDPDKWPWVVLQHARRV